MRMPAFFERDRTFTEPIYWVTASVMVGIHIGAVAALFVFSWRAFILAMFLCWVAGSLGTGMGYHRLLTHRGYKTPKWTEYFLTVCGTLALQGGPIFWVATHRLHHQNTDKDGDPHSPRDGGLWSHIGWIFTGHAHSQSSRHGLAWFEFDPNWYGISALRMLGLAWDIKARPLNSTADAGQAISHRLPTPQPDSTIFQIGEVNQHVRTFPAPSVQ
jgi:fatty-acid desaturase